MSENTWCDSSASGTDQQPSTTANYEAKIFVGGLEWSTTADDLKTYFEKYGTVVESEVKIDHHTGQSRGFAFVTFADPSSVDAVVSVRDHFIGGRKIDPKRIKFRDTLKAIHKIFVGGIDASISEAAIREYFSQFGTIDEIDLPYDHQRQERRHFCFIRFTSSEPVERLCRQPFHTIAGQTVEVKKMMSKTEKMLQPAAMSMADYAHYDFGVRSRGRGLSGYNVGSLHPMANYGPSYVDSRQPLWQHGTADYGVGQSTMPDFSSAYGIRQSSVVGRGSRLAPMSGYGTSSYGGGVGQPVMTDPASSYRGGRQPSLSAGRGMAAIAGSRQLSTAGYGSYADSRHAAGTVQDYGDHVANANSNGVNWSASMNYQPRYSGAALSQQPYVRPPAGSGMSRGQRYQPYSR